VTPQLAGNPISSSFSSTPVVLHAFSFGNTFIARSCGNYSFDRSATPIPTVSGTKFHDRNGNGVRDGGEEGLGFWTMRLHDPDGNTIATTTDAAGNYTFAVHTRPGNYFVTEDGQAGWVQSAGPSSFAINEGVGNQNFGDKNFGNFQLGSVSGRKFEDMNGNGADNSDPGVVGWPIQLTGTTGLGAPVGPTVVLTGPGGAYSFPNLAPGSYTLTEGTQPGWEQSYPQPAPPGTYQFMVVSGENKTGRDFGNYRFATVAGRKYEDSGADGSGAGDLGLQGWTIHLDGTSGLGVAVNRTVLTEPSGDYLFTNVAPGAYVVTETPQLGWTAKEGNAGYAISVLSGDNITGLLFGNWRHASIAGEKYDDTNGNGQRDAGEPTLPGWDIHLDGADGMGTPVHLVQTTDGVGAYNFGNLVPGHYTISEVLRVDEDWAQSEPVGGTYVVDSRSGDNIVGKRFGNLVKAEAHSMKFQDMAENGVKDAPVDGGLGGWTVTLTGVDGRGSPISLSTVTAGDGTYAFLHIWPGPSYTVCETNPDPVRWYQTLPGGTGCYQFLLGSHQKKQDVDFGNYDRGSIEGIKFSDHNKNGARDAIDEALDGWQVTLTDCATAAVIPQAATGVPTTPGQTSDPNPQITHSGGQYRFGGLHNGQYCVNETLQTPRWVQTMPCFDPAVCGYTHSALLSGTHIVGNDFGNFQLPSVDKSPDLANLFICQAGPCSGIGEGHLVIIEKVQNVHTGDQNNDGIEDGLGAYEFTAEFDSFVVISINPADIVFSPGGAGAARGPATCTFSIVTENFVRFGCVTTGQSRGPTGNFDLARLDIVPAADDAKDLFPGNDNGINTIVKDNGCELVDVFGHPVIGAINGGLTPFCNDAAITVRILEGDLNLDCKVDVVDEAMIAQHYGATFGSAFYDKWFDVEPRFHDLDVDIKDLQKVFGRDGSTCQNPIPAQPPIVPPFPMAGSGGAGPTVVPTATPTLPVVATEIPPTATPAPVHSSPTPTSAPPTATPTPPPIVL
jgi:hypothetical protein